MLHADEKRIASIMEAIAGTVLAGSTLSFEVLDHELQSICASLHSDKPGLATCLDESQLAQVKAAAARLLAAEAAEPLCLPLGDAQHPFRLIVALHRIDHAEDRVVLVRCVDTLALPDAATRRFGRAAGLSTRELEVVAHLCSGLDATAVSTRLEIALPTVRSHIQSILRKLHVGTQQQALRIVYAAATL